jgi:putative transport protein
LSAIADLPIDAAAQATLAAHAPLADAITYGFGDLGLILFLTWLGPLILRADLKREAKALEQKLAAASPGGDVPSGTYYGLRAYRVENAAVSGATLGALEARYATARLSVQRVQRGAELLQLTPALALNDGDRLVVSAQRGAFVNAEREIGSEVDDPALLSIPIQAVAVVVTNASIAGKTIAELAQAPAGRGVYLQSIQRGTEFMPREPWTVVERGDVLKIVGAPEDVERASRLIGFAERDLSRTDLTFLAGAICAGILFGLIKLNASGVSLGLGTAGSILIIGLVGGWARSRYPVFGAIPEPAQRLLMDIGLIVFIAVVGLHAGPHAVEAYRASGGSFFASIFVAGVIVTTLPLAVGTLVGRYVLKLSPLMLVGGLAGSQTCTPGLTALREASESNVVALAYTVPYAIGNIILTIWGPIVVAIVHAMRS